MRAGVSTRKTHARGPRGSSKELQGPESFKFNPGLSDNHGGGFITLKYLDIGNEDLHLHPFLGPTNVQGRPNRKLACSLGNPIF